MSEADALQMFFGLVLACGGLAVMANLIIVGGFLIKVIRVVWYVLLFPFRFIRRIS